MAPLDLEPTARDLAALVGAGPGWRASTGVITTVAGNSYGMTANVVSATFDGASTAITGIPYLGPPPQVGDVGLFLIWETARIMVGALGPTGAPRCRVHKTDAMTITSGANSPVPWNVHDYTFSSTAMWVVGNATRITAPITGTYHLTAGWVWDLQAAGGGQRRIVDMVANGTTLIKRSEHQQDSAATVGIGHDLSTDWYFTAGQYWELVVYQDSGVNMFRVTGAAQDQLCNATMHLISPGS